MKFAAQVLAIAALVTCLGVAQDLFRSDNMFSSEQLNRQVPELLLQRHVHGHVYCPPGETKKTEISLRPFYFGRGSLGQIKKLQTDKDGYFDFADMPAGQYELVVKNECPETRSAVDHFYVKLHAEPTVFRDCVLGEIIVQLREQAKPEVSRRPTKNSACG